MARVRRHQVFDLILEHLTTHQQNPQLEPALSDLNAAAPHFRNAVARLMDARPSALGAASYDGPGIAGGGTSSSTERLALNPDRTAADLVKLDAALGYLWLHVKADQLHVAAVCRHARTVWTITHAWTPHAPTDKQRSAVAAANVPECAHTRATVDKHEPVHRTTDCGGVLPAPVALCRFVYDFTRREGRLPSPAEMDRHHQGRRINLPA